MSQFVILFNTDESLDDVWLYTKGVFVTLIATRHKGKFTTFDLLSLSLNTKLISLTNPNTRRRDPR